MTSWLGDGRVASPPLTERLLDRVPLPRPLTIAVWSLVPMLSPLVFSTAIGVSGEPLDSDAFLDLVATQAGLAFATFVLIAGAGILWRRSQTVGAAIAALLGSDAPRSVFGAIGSVAGPVALAVLVATIVSAGGWAAYGPLPPLAALPFLVVYLVPIMTYVWVYLVCLVELDRIGRRPLRLDTFPQDRALGLQKLGGLASTGLGLLLAAVAPVLVAGSDEPLTFAVSVAIVLVSLAAFVLSMWRLHRQMAAAKERHVLTARQLYAGAYEPIRREPTIRILEGQSAALRAAQSLDERAASLLTWPVDEGALRFVAVIVTSVLTSVIVRALFAAVGF